MTTNVYFSCIIPFYNERNRILNIISAISKVKLVKQIICVDDGSTDYASELIRKQFPNITLVKLNKNQGKAGAVFSGLQKTTYQNILLLDGDLQNIIPSEIENALRSYYENKLIDMVIFRIKGDNLIIDSLLRKYIFQGGNRILKKPDLIEVVKRKPKGYQLEVAMNQYMMDSHKKVFWTNCSTFNPHKTHKYSFLSGLIRDLKMDIQIISYLGVIAYLKQMFLFCKKEL